MSYDFPDKQGHFGPFGGTFVPETLIAPLEALKVAYEEALQDPQFISEVNSELSHFVGRPTPLYHAKNWSQAIGGAQIYFKREDLAHTGAHKINNTVGQTMLAKRMGKTRIIAETGAGQHGVATATIAAKLGLQCIVYMGDVDAERQALNVYRMNLLGAEVRRVKSGSQTLKDALNEALRDWVSNIDDTFYVIGTVAGPHPYPAMVRDFQAVIGEETKEQSIAQLGQLPTACVACVGGGSNAMGMFYPFIDDEAVKLYGVEAAGTGIETGEHAAPLCDGSIGVLHGNRTYLMQDEGGNILPTHSVSAGLDYPGVGPEHAWLKDINRAEYVAATDSEAMEAFHEVTTTEGIMPALETSHALAFTKRLAASMQTDETIVVCLSGRGDKDVHTIAAYENKSLG